MNLTTLTNSTPKATKFNRRGLKSAFAENKPSFSIVYDGTKGKIMQLSEHISNLQMIYKKHGDLKVIYAKDEEGNSFNEVAYDPSVGKFKNREFEQTDDNPDSVCIN